MTPTHASLFVLLEMRGDCRVDSPEGDFWDQRTDFVRVSTLAVKSSDALKLGARQDIVQVLWAMPTLCMEGLRAVTTFGRSFTRNVLIHRYLSHWLMIGGIPAKLILRKFMVRGLSEERTGEQPRTVGSRTSPTGRHRAVAGPFMPPRGEP